MITLTIKDNDKVTIIDDYNKKKYRWGMIAMAVGFIILTKLYTDHDEEITELKKVIKEMKSKGE